MGLMPRLLCMLLCAMQITPAMARPLESLPVPLQQQLQVETVEMQQGPAVRLPGNGGVYVPDLPSGEAGAILLPLALIAMLVTGVHSAVRKHQATVAGQALVPVDTLLEGNDFGQRFQGELQAHFPADLSPEPRFNFRSMPATASAALSGIPRDQLPAVAQLIASPAAPGEHRLLITPACSFTQDFGALDVDIVLTYWAGEPVRKWHRQPKAEFTRRYVWSYSLPKQQGGGTRDNAARWQAMGRDRLAALLDNAIVQSVALVGFDFSAEGRALELKANLPGLHATRRIRDQAGAVVSVSESHKVRIYTAVAPADVELAMPAPSPGIRPGVATTQPPTAAEIVEALGTSAATSAETTPDAAP